MRTTAKVDYAVRAVVALALIEADHGDHEPVKAHELATREDIPPKFLETILADLKRSRLVTSRRGATGGYRLGRPADEITVADVVRAVEGPLADVRGERPEAIRYPEGLEALQRMWIAVRANLRAVLESTTVADLASGHLPPEVDVLADPPDAWDAR